MDGQLPDIAVDRFRSVLEDNKLSSDAQAYTTLALAEALIRSSLTIQGSANQAADALELLETEELAQIPSSLIWKAEALATLGRYLDAEEALKQIKDSNPLFSQSQLARARIQIALNKTNEALISLNSLSSSKDTDIRNTSSLLAAEIQIQQSNFEEASKSLDKIDGQNLAAVKLKEYLQAQLLLSEGGSAEAANQFQALVTAPDLFSERIYHACVLGLIDAQAANEQSDDAINTLLEYINNNIDSNNLQPFFMRLPQLLPKEIEPDSPTLIRLREWSDNLLVAGNPIIPVGDSSDSLPIQISSNRLQNDRAILSLYYRAKLLARSKKSNYQVQALTLFARLRALQPSPYHFPNELYDKLISASMLDTAYLHLKLESQERATFSLEVMEKTTSSPQLKDQANFLLGLLLAEEMKHEDALSAFNFARLSTASDIASAASINAGIMSLLASNLTTFEKIADSHEEQKGIRTALILERALWKCSTGELSGRNDLESFIIAYPGHPRENEARLALAAACVDISPVDFILAKAQLEITSPRLTREKDQLLITGIGIRAEERNQDWLAAIAIADAFIKDYPDSPNLAGIMLKKGEALYHNEDFNASRRIFQEIAEKYPESPIKPYADFYAAMAARLGGTNQSREECITMFQKIIDDKHPLSAEARIQQSRVLIDLRRYSQAEEALTPLKDSKQAAIYRDANILLADCLHRQGATNSEKYDAAITIYNNLLAGETSPSWNHRIHYLRGQTYESMKQKGKALDSYLDVILRADAKQPQLEKGEEWFWFYRCGFKALAMLESEKRWEPAVKLARRIASFKGPRAEEAEKRAINLAKTHMIWEE